MKRIVRFPVNRLIATKRTQVLALGLVMNRIAEIVIIPFVAAVFEAFGLRTVKGLLGLAFKTLFRCRTGFLGAFRRF